MNPMRARLFVLLLALISGAAFAAGQIYQWKDASGGIHFTDTPPPRGAALLKGPKTAEPSNAGAAHAPVPDVQCRPDITPEQCAAAKAALQRDAQDIARSSSLDPPASTDSKTDAQWDQQHAAILARQCVDMRQQLAVLERRQNGGPHEIMTDAERVQMHAELPGQIASLKAGLLERKCP